jgi:hypothetical protein
VGKKIDEIVKDKEENIQDLEHQFTEKLVLSGTT